MGGLDPAKILMILLVALVVLGPERLPRAARQLGSAWRELTRLREKLETEVRGALPDLDLPKIPVIPRHGITGYIAGMMTSTDEKLVTASNTEALDYEDDDARTLPASVAGARGLWVSSANEIQAPSGLPAGWNVVGAESPGYASGSLLSPVPTVPAAGPLVGEGELSFDEPSWN
ncbi:MAG: twin-arginine translocase TatA/TatE family subunit [Acidimicrobiales bacterium]